VVPPFLTYSAGPLLGPSLLQAAARRNGYHCRLLDLNALWIRSKIVVVRKATHQPLDFARPIFVGDHDKPASVLSSSEKEFFSEYILPSLKQLSTTPRGDNHGIGAFDSTVDTDGSLLRRIQFGFLGHDEVEPAASFLASSASLIGPWLKQQLVTWPSLWLLRPTSKMVSCSTIPQM
jgi:hypothetical protein